MVLDIFVAEYHLTFLPPMSVPLNTLTAEKLKKWIINYYSLQFSTYSPSIPLVYYMLYMNEYYYENE